MMLIPDAVWHANGRITTENTQMQCKDMTLVITLLFALLSTSMMLARVPALSAACICQTKDSTQALFIDYCLEFSIEDELPSCSIYFC